MKLVVGVGVEGCIFIGGEGISKLEDLKGKIIGIF